MLISLPKNQPLYKFKAVESEEHWAHVREVIVDGRLFFSRPAQLNDLFECKPEFVLDGTEEEKLRYLDRLYRSKAPDLSEEERKLEVEITFTRFKGLNEDLAANLKEQIHAAYQSELGVLCLV